ncbi:hypothetical protein AB0C81_15600 [Streptomyces roseoverticillatus]
MRRASPKSQTAPFSASATGAGQVVWIDSTTGYGDVVTRARPAGTCG